MLLLSCVCYSFELVCLLMPCGHLLGKGWPLGSRLWCLIVCLSLSHVLSWVSGGVWLYPFLIFALFLTLKLMAKKIITILCSYFLLIWTYVWLFVLSLFIPVYIVFIFLFSWTEPVLIQGSHRNSKTQFHDFSMIFHDQQCNYHDYLIHSMLVNHACIFK